MSPDLCVYSDEAEKNLKIEVELPGVKKENIKLKMEEDGVYLIAKTNKIEYMGSYALCCPVLPRKA
jgi:HSP20 family molecular chaperone IbpA